MLLKACCDLAIDAPGRTVERLCEAFAEHADVRRRGPGATIRMSYGRLTLAASNGALRIAAKAVDETGLAYVKMGVVHNLREVAGETATVRWRGAGLTEGPPPFFRQMRVVRAFDVTPAMRRVVLSGVDLARFAHGALHVRLFFPPAGRDPVWPVIGEDGCPVWPQGEDTLVGRVYTIRAIDVPRNEICVDILRHDGDTTPGSAFAASAREGDVVGMAGPLGDGVPQAPSLFLFGDETAIPAIERILCAAPAACRVQAVVEISGPAERQALPTGEGRSVEWLYRGTGPTLAERVAALTPQMLGEDGFVWAACEFADFLAIRRECRRRLGLKRERHHVVAYWRKQAHGG